MAFTPITDEPARGDFPPVGLLGLGGTERAKVFADGLLPRPPISHLFGLMPQSRTDEEAVFTMPASPWLQTSFGVFFASTAVLAADAPFGSALVPSMAPGMYGTTSEVSMSFLRPASPARTIYGGITAFFADTAITAAIQTTLPANTVSALVDLKVNYTRPAIPDGRILRARATVVHRGQRMAVARADLINADDKTFAIATGSAMILEGRVWDVERPVVAVEDVRADGD